MNEGREKQRYEKPVAVNLGGVATIVGQSCAVGDIFEGGSCYPAGNSATLDCTLYGGSAGAICADGIGFAPVGCFAAGMMPMDCVTQGITPV